MAPEKKGHTYIQWIYSIIVSIGFLIYGMEIGWTSPMQKVLQADPSPLGNPISTTMISWIASIVVFSSAGAVPIYSYLANIYGRKWMVVATTIPQMISSSIKILFPNITVLCIARTLSGLFTGGVFVVGPMYVREISQPDMIGSLGSIQVVLQNMGFLIIYLLGAYMEYFQVLYVMAAFPVLMAVLMLRAPESPAFLVKLGKIEEAHKAVAYLRGLDTDDKIVITEVEAMQRQEKEFQAMPKLNFISILKDKAWRRGLIIILIIFTFHAWNGAFAIIAYASAILSSTGVDFGISPELQTLSFPIVSILASFTLTAVAEKFERKPLLAGTFFISVFSQSILGIAMLMQKYGYVIPSWLPVVCMIVSVATYAGGIRPLPYIILTEMFSFQVRTRVMGCVVTHAWITGAVQLFAYAPIADAFGLPATFILFGVFNLLGAIVTFFLPETRGKTDEEIQQQLLKGSKQTNTV
ncbi:facilitated trehalose transporter Tret1-2 homolog [Pieris rapae]|uniref:facilitated trehalose transporter Tret1-2 homolog n=1 Tax=Pieris rapae TaxID=64459 RepID=UPI001E2819B1|nr:facilitated trehalose transporter Tret1-2 homolog [Pieris rapae]